MSKKTKLLPGCLSIMLAFSMGISIVSLAPVHAHDVGTMLTTVIEGAHRSEENRARDKYRHPAETLLFFGLRPDMTVVEISPSNGWYTEIIAPLLKKQGQLYAGPVAVVTAANLVEINGIEPLTSCMPCKRSPS